MAELSQIFTHVALSVAQSFSDGVAICYVPLFYGWRHVVKL